MLQKSNNPISDIFITGGKGQLGQAIQDMLTRETDAREAVARDYRLTIADLPEVDITERGSFFPAVEQAEPDLIIHCAAYTDVNGCALDPRLAYRVNAHGTRNVALACQAHGIPLLHLSTNEVFAGDEPEGYAEWMPLDPINPYGHSKAAAEFIVRSLTAQHYIVRIAWLFALGGRNFVHTILRYARANGHLRVVTDEIGNPTYARDVAGAISQLIASESYGTYHFVNSGACSRWAFAKEILRLAGLDDVPVQPIRLRDYKRPSTPPRFGALNNQAGAALGIVMRPWQDALADFMSNSAVGIKLKS